MIYREEDLFNALKDSIMPDLEQSEGFMSHYDCYSIKHNMDIELKCRRTHYDELLIEKMKFDALILRSEKYGTIPVYINSTPDGVWAFKLLELPEPIWSQRLMPQTTDFAKREKIEKEVGYYSVYMGTDITDSLTSLLK